MPTIKSDFLGLYVAAGGYAARPLGETQFKEGDEVKTHHFGGSIRAGVGKDSSCKRGQYLEEWTTTGFSTNELETRKSQFGLKLTDKDIKKNTEWYLTGGPQQLQEDLELKI